MQTLSELLATFPDPPKTLLNTTKSSSALSRGGGGMLGVHHMKNGSQSNSSGSLPPAGVAMGANLDMGLGVGRTLTPKTASAIAAGGASAGSTGYQDADLSLLERSSREDLDAVTQGQVFTKIFSEPVLVVERALDIAYTNARTALLKDLAAAKKKKIEKLEKDCPCSAAVFTNKHYLDFGSHLAVGQEVTDTLDLTNNTPNKIKFRIVVPQQACAMETDAFSLKVTPSEGIIKKKDQAHFQFKLQAKQPGLVKLVVFIAVEGGLKFHAVVKQEIFAQ